MDLKAKQKEILENKRKKGHNSNDIPTEFCHLYWEVGEVYNAWRNRGDYAAELADVVISALGIAEMLGIDLSAEIEKRSETIEATPSVSHDVLMEIMMREG